VSIQELLWTIQNLPQNWQNILDVLLVAAMFFGALQLVRGERAATLLRGIAIVVVSVWVLSIVLNLTAFSWLLSRILTGVAIAVPVIFQEDLRRWFDRIGRMVQTREEGSTLVPGNPITAICDATQMLSRRRHGALIVLERETGIQEYIDSGIPIDGVVSSELLQTTFFPNTALHDGAVIVRGERLVAAACTLPVSSARHLPDSHMGLRHRAALGISEVSDTVTVVVSEETGRISVVVNGRFIRGIDAERLAMILGEYIPQREPPSLMTWFQQLGRAA